MTPAEQRSVVALVTHVRDVPASERERFATSLRDQSVGASIVLETCHRVEAYLVSTADGTSVAERLPANGRVLVGEDAIRHAITVAVGRDSVVVGEDQILHQLRASVERARRNNSLHPILERLFALGLRAGRRARSWREGQAPSLADVALSLVERRAGPIVGREVLIVGAGKMGRLAVSATVAAGASVSVANRSPDRAIAISVGSGGRVEAFDPGPAIDRFAAVIVALGGPWAVGLGTVKSLVESSTVVVDLSVPAAVSIGLSDRLGPRLISADDLALADVDAVALNDRSIARLDALIAATTAEFLTWLEARGARAAAAALTARAEQERHSELEALWRRLPDLDADARDAIERMSEHLANRLLREPLERLGRDADGRNERAMRELFGL
ncbi:MAG: NAD(P)-binding domain-containing protein [Candidatus Limnocylindrales bacterium]